MGVLARPLPSNVDGQPPTERHALGRAPAITHGGSTVKLVPAVLASVVLAVVANAGQAQQTPPRTPHPVAGKEQCLSCHAANANRNIRSQPAAHRFPASACVGCHPAVTTRPPAVQHPLSASYAQCRTCHKAGGPQGVRVPPASHARYNVAICGVCHSTRTGGTRG
jgi:hypothetical protein